MHRIITIGAVFIALLLCGYRAEACDCIVPAPKDAFNLAEAVFTGKVIEVSEDKGRTLLEVSAIWKGISPWRKKIELRAVSGTCYYELKQGQEYLLYAGRESEGLFTNICYPNRLLVDARKDLLDLGRPRWRSRGH